MSDNSRVVKKGGDKPKATAYKRKDDPKDNREIPNNNKLTFQEMLNNALDD